jgi:hypothetical protein
VKEKQKGKRDTKVKLNRKVKNNANPPTEIGELQIRRQATETTIEENKKIKHSNTRRDIHIES